MRSNNAEAFHFDWLDGVRRNAGARRGRASHSRKATQAPAGKRAVAQAAPAQPPVAATAPAPSPPREWTGESGSSGHPLMQATAIRQAAANFEQCLEGLWPLAQKRGVSRATYDKHVGGLTPDLRIMDLMDAQPEFTKAFWDYLDILVHDQRIAGGRELLDQIQAGVRSGREGLWRRPPHRHVDLGRGVRTTAPWAATAR